MLEVLRFTLNNVDQGLKRKFDDRLPRDLLFGHQVESFQDHTEDGVDLGILREIFVCLSNIHQRRKYSSSAIVTLVHGILKVDSSFLILKQLSI